MSALIEQVKRKLNITWDDEDTDARVADILDSALVTMRYKLGLSDDFDFEAKGQENTLLLAYCLYEWNHAANEFDANYLGDILQVRQKHEVKAHEADGL
jgi:hypothetical protein